MFEKHLAELAAEHLTRRLLPLESGTGPVVRIAGREVLLFASNDYLGLACHPEVVDAAVRATQAYGAGTGAARLISGSLPPHGEMEQALARFKGTEAALTFGSGYLANIGVIPALSSRGGLILADRLCHASLIDGCRLSQRGLSNLSAQRHGPPGILAVEETPGSPHLDRDRRSLQHGRRPRSPPRLSRLPRTMKPSCIWMMPTARASWDPTDEGPSNISVSRHVFRFTWERWEKHSEAVEPTLLDLRRSIQYLVHTSRSFIFTTAPPPGSAAAVDCGATTYSNGSLNDAARLWENRERTVRRTHAQPASLWPPAPARSCRFSSVAPIKP